MPTDWPCPSLPVNCPNADNSPLINNSSELPDSFTFFGEAYGPNYNPPLGWTWSNPVAYATCYDSASQDDADACAATAATNSATQSGAGWLSPSGQPMPPHHAVYNQPQTLNGECPDGSLYYYTVPGGLFGASSQEAANQAALDYGNQQLGLHALCFSDLADVICQGEGANLAITPSSNFLAPPDNNVWTCSTLPAGLVFNGPGTGPATITGIPTTPGIYAFVVGITLPNGDFTERLYNLTVAGITNSLPQATVGQAYTGALTTTGFSTPVFTLNGGMLPDGLTLNVDGTITGTPAADAVNETFTVNILDGETGFECNQSVTLTVSTLAIDFAKLIWGTPGYGCAFGSGTGSLSASGNTSSGSMANSGACLCGGSITSDGTLAFNGAATSCNGKITLSGTCSSNLDVQASVVVQFTDSSWVSQTFAVNVGTIPATGFGTFNFPFTVPAAMGKFLQVQVNLQGGGGTVGSLSVNYAVTLTPAT